MSNIVDAYPREGVVFRTKPLFQWDWGQIVRLHISDLPAAYKVEFSNSTRADAVSTVQTTDEVTAPAQFLESGNPVYAWVVVVDEARTTEYSLIIPVSARAKPTDLEPAPEEQTEIEQTLSALNEAISDVQEIADAIPDTINDALEAAKESGEFDGEDGFSPEVTVSPIQGGHRITITDANGTHTVDVLDGEKGDTGRGIVSVQKTGTAGLVDTYTITYTDSTTSTFTVKNGQNGTPGADGTTFTPAVSAEGVISWTNDGGKPNPQPLNIKGPQGDDYVLTAADKQEIAQQTEELLAPVLDTKAPAIWEDASGSIAHFEDGAEDMPLREINMARNIIIVNATQVVTSESNPQGIFSVMTDFPKVFDNGVDGDIEQNMKNAKAAYFDQLSKNYANTNSNRIMATVTLEMANGEQILRESIGGLPAPEPEPEPEQE